MLFTTASIFAVMSMSVAAKNSRTFAVNRFYGKGPLTTGRMDPIVSPGVASSHHHTIQGGSNFALTMTDTQLLTSTCTSSKIKNDKSNYWVPSLFFQDPNDGTFTPVPMFYMNVYYFFEATNDKITAFEPGHRMVIGNPKLRSPPASGGKLIIDLADGEPQPVQWVCPRSNTNTPLYPPNSDGLHGVGIGDPINKGAGVGFSDKNCDGYASPLRADIHFPSCYNPAAGLDNYKTNMQFPTSVGGGKADCPPGWVHTPHIFFEVYWNTALFASKWTQGQGKQPFVLSNGDLTGYSLHADFLSGWDPATLQQIIDNCDAGDSGMDKCPGLIGGINDSGTSCNIAPAIPEPFTIDDKLTTKLTALPGNNPVTGWGSAPGSGTGSTSTTSPAPASTSAATQGPSTPGSGTGSGTGTGSGPDPSSAPATKDTPTSTAVSGSTSPTLTADVNATDSSTSATGWTHYGCYSDKLGSGNRVLSGVTFANIGNHQVTNTKCIAYCDKKGFSMAGTEYGGQCFCGNALVGSTELAEDKCNMACEGDEKEICGGQLALSVYKKAGSARRRRHLSAHARKHIAKPLKV